MLPRMRTGVTASNVNSISSEPLRCSAKWTFVIRVSSSTGRTPPAGERDTAGEGSSAADGGKAILPRKNPNATVHAAPSASPDAGASTAGSNHPNQEERRATSFLSAILNSWRAWFSRRSSGSIPGRCAMRRAWSSSSPAYSLLHSSHVRRCLSRTSRPSASISPEAAMKRSSL